MGVGYGPPYNGDFGPRCAFGRRSRRRVSHLRRPQRAARPVLRVVARLARPAHVGQASRLGRSWT